jgi:hypothetical protein
VSSPAALAADQLIPVADAPDDDGLDLSPRAHRGCQIVEGPFVESLPGVFGIRFDTVDGKEEQPVAVVSVPTLAERAGRAAGGLASREEGLADWGKARFQGLNYHVELL